MSERLMFGDYWVFSAEEAQQLAERIEERLRLVRERPSDFASAPIYSIDASKDRVCRFSGSDFDHFSSLPQELIDVFVEKLGLQQIDLNNCTIVEINMEVDMDSRFQSPAEELRTFIEGGVSLIELLEKLPTLSADYEDNGHEYFVAVSVLLPGREGRLVIKDAGMVLPFETDCRCELDDDCDHLDEVEFSRQIDFYIKP